MLLYVTIQLCKTVTQISLKKQTNSDMALIYTLYRHCVSVFFCWVYS